MCRKGALIVAFLLLQVSLSMAQKVKYKDLMELLNAKQYEMAEPFLRRYLTDNTDNASAYLYMGIIYQEKSLKNDLLKQTEALIINIDSAIFFYDKAYPMITEKEIKRNDENYQMYTRRDLRTGEFGIKMSDVQLDIETRVKGLKEKREKVKPLKNNFLQSQKLYNRANEFFKGIQDKYANEKEFYLRSDEQLLVELNNLIAVYDSSQVAFKSYKSILQTMGKTDYNQELTLLEINDFKKDGLTSADFLLNDLRLWDYTRWAHKSFEIIQKEIVPLRENLISYDIEINKLHERLKKDSVSVKSDLTKLVDKILLNQLTKFDLNPMPMAVFNMKIAELEYYSNLCSDKLLLDSSNVAVRIHALQSEIKSVKKLDSISSLLVKRDFDKEALDYKHFITTAYGTSAVLKSYVKATHEFAQRELITKEKEWEENMQALKWVFSEMDSIPLFTDDSDKRIYKPLVIVNEQYTLGLKYVDSLAVGYFYTITPSRIPDIALNFPVDAQHFKKRNLPIIKAISFQDTNQVYFALFYSESKDADGFPATLTKVNRSGGLAWSNNYKFELKPSELLFSSSTGELTIKTTSTNGESKIVVIDQHGKKLQ
jgi:hypothetical protein